MIWASVAVSPPKCGQFPTPLCACEGGGAISRRSAQASSDRRNHTLRSASSSAWRTSRSPAPRTTGCEVDRPAVDGDGLAVDVGAVVARPGTGPRGRSRRGSPQRVSGLSWPILSSVPRARAPSKIGLVMPVSIRPGADGVDPHAGAVELVGRGLGQADHAGLGGRIGHAAGAGADAGHRGGADDRALAARRP